jgi:hypothetical protein
MVFGITKGYDKKCKNKQGGVQRLFVFPFVKYLRSQIIIDSEYLTSFPTTTIFEFETEVISFSESMQENEGGKYYSQNLSFSLVGNSGSFDIQKLIHKDYRIIIQDRNGNYKILGLYTGLECTNLTEVTGGGKSELNGFNLSFEGQEIRSSLFIDDLFDAGFIIYSAEPTFRLLEDGSFRLLEDNFKRLLE